MRFRSKKSRLCRISVGTLCVIALLYLVWLKNDVAGHLTEIIVHYSVVLMFS